MSKASRKLVADVVRTNYILNKQAYKELEHYKKTKKLLGDHPIFERQRLKDEISALNGLQLSNKIKALKTNIFRNKQKGNTDLVLRDEVLLNHAENIAEQR